MQHRQLKYGRIERERRWLLAGLPDVAFDGMVDIVDRYLVGTRLRLRTMVDPTDPTRTVYKLARKHPPHASGAVVMGNLYLDPGEHRMLATLPANVLRKRRHRWGPWGVDVFGPPHEGLVLAEIEDDDADRLATHVPPFTVLREVTDDPSFRGGVLAGGSP